MIWKNLYILFNIERDICAYKFFILWVRKRTRESTFYIAQLSLSEFIRRSNPIEFIQQKEKITTRLMAQVVARKGSIEWMKD